MMIAISAAGAYRSDDGGATWQARNHGVRAEFLPDKHPEFGQCVHKIAHHPTNPGRLFLQNHWGLYRSEDWGDSWVDIANGVPSDFGFAMAMHPGIPTPSTSCPSSRTAFAARRTRSCACTGRATAGRAGTRSPRGFRRRTRTRRCCAMRSRRLAPGQVFFGTRSGKVYASRDDGDSWELVRDGLPPVVCVKACVA